MATTLCSPCIVLLGESGHGKSTIVNNLRDTSTQNAEVGKRAGGVTRMFSAYAMPSSWNLDLVDTPGIGCRHTSFYNIIADAERMFTERHVRGIVVTCPVDSPRLMLGTHIVQALVSLGFRQQDAWDQIVFVGTKCDKADDAEPAFFESELVSHFFRFAPDGGKIHALVHADDCSELLAALRKLPERSLVYEQPEAEHLASELAPLLGEDLDSCAQAIRAARQGEEYGNTLSILVLGECGDGKSTLINALRDPVYEEQRAGKHPKGVTKEMRCVPGLPLRGRNVRYYDTPGVGDMDISPADLCTMLEAILSSGDINGVIVTCPATNKYIRLGGRLVQQLVDMGFHGEERWARVILAGTKSDRADVEECHNFRTTLKNDFFSKALAAGEKCGEAVLCSCRAGGYEDLKHCIVSLPAGKLSYSPPPAEQYCHQVGSLLGIDPAMLEKERQEMNAVLREVDVQQRHLQETLAELARKEQELTNMRLFVAAQEARFQQEMEDHEQAVQQCHANEQLREADRLAAARRTRLVEEELRRFQQESNSMLRRESLALEEHKEKLRREQQQYLRHAQEAVRRHQQDSNDAGIHQRLLSSVTSLFRSLVGT